MLLALIPCWSFWLLKVGSLKDYRLWGKSRCRVALLEVLEEHPCSAHPLVSYLPFCAGEWSRLLLKLHPQLLEALTSVPLCLWPGSGNQVKLCRLRVPHILHQYSIGDEEGRIFGSHNVVYHHFHLKRTKIHELMSIPGWYIRPCVFVYYCKGFWNLTTNIHTYNLEWDNFKRNMIWFSGMLTEVLSKSLILWLTVTYLEKW